MLSRSSVQCRVSRSGTVPVLFDVGHVVRVLVEDAPRAHPLAARVPEHVDAGARRAAVHAAIRVVVLHHDDLGAIVVVDVDHDGELAQRAAGVAAVEEHRAVGAAEDAEDLLVVVEHLREAIALEVEEARARRARAAIARHVVPEAPSVVIEDHVGEASREGDLGVRIRVEVADGGRASAVGVADARDHARQLRRVDVDGAPHVIARGRVDRAHEVPAAHVHDLGIAVEIEVGDGDVAARQRGPTGRVGAAIPDRGAVVVPHAEAAHELEVLVGVDVGERVVRGACAALVADAAHDGAVGVRDDEAHRDLRRAVAVHVAHRGRVVAAGHVVGRGVEGAKARARRGDDHEPSRPARSRVARRARDDLGAGRGGIDVGDRDLAARRRAIAGIGRGPHTRSVGARDRAQHSVGPVVRAGERVEDDLGDVVRVDVAVTVVVGEVGDHGRHHHLVVPGQDHGVAGPAPLLGDLEGADRRAVLARLAHRARQAAHRGGLAVLARGALARLGARRARRDAGAEVAELCCTAARRRGALAARRAIGAAVEHAAIGLAGAIRAAARAAAELRGRAAQAHAADLADLAAALAAHPRRLAARRRVRASVEATTVEARLAGPIHAGEVGAALARAGAGRALGARAWARACAVAAGGQEREERSEPREATHEGDRTRGRQHGSVGWAGFSGRARPLRALSVRSRARRAALQQRRRPAPAGPARRAR